MGLGLCMAKGSVNFGQKYLFESTIIVDAQLNWINNVMITKQ